MGQAYWYHQRWKLRAADHAGICLLISGTYAPTMDAACSPDVLAFVWIVGVVSVAIKSGRGRFDRMPVHLLALLLMGFAVVSIWSRVVDALSPWCVDLIKLGGAMYTTGLVPWALLKKMEFNICIWHVFVLLGSGCYFAMVYGELLGATAPALECIAT